MFNSFCSFFSEAAQSNHYAYEVFQKVPQLSVFIQSVSLLQEIKNSQANFNRLNSEINDCRNRFELDPIDKMNNKIDAVDFSRIVNKFTNNTTKQSRKASKQNLEGMMKSNENQVLKQIMKSNYSKLINDYNQKGSKRFKDPDFPPNGKSIGNFQDFAIINCSWKSIAQIISHPQMIAEKIQPEDILQGGKSDSQFLTALAALAEYDFRIKNVFPSLQVNKNGIYMARILHQGVLKEVVVNDYVPVTEKDAPIFAKPIFRRQIWVMILEKCWAKLHGSYRAIIGRTLNEVLRAFSGAPTFQRPTLQMSKQLNLELWQQLFQTHQKGGILCCSTKVEMQVEKVGLTRGQTYKILAVFQTPYRLLKIRNLWGKTQWIGRASQSDIQFWASIGPADKRKLNYAFASDKTFFILWDDFVKYFRVFNICKVNDNANYLNIDAQFDKKRGQMFQIQSQGGDLVLCLSQKTKRGFCETEEKREYSRSTLIIARKAQEAPKGYEYKYIHSGTNRLFSEHILQLKGLVAGRYVVFTKFDWAGNSASQGVISIYSESNISIRNSDQSQHPHFLFKTFLDHARKNQKKQTISQDPNEWVCSDFLLNESGYGYLVIHLDQKSSKKIGVQINEKSYTERRLFLKKPYKGGKVIKAIVEAGKELIVLFRIKAYNYPTSITLPIPKICILSV